MFVEPKAPCVLREIQLGHVENVPHIGRVASVSSGAGRPRYLRHHFHVRHYRCEVLTDGVQRLLLLVAVHDVHQLSKLVLQIWIFVVERGLELFDNRESGLLEHGNVVGFLKKWNVIGLLRHQEVESVTSGSYTSGSSHPVDVLLDFACEVIVNDPVDAFEIKTPRCHIRTNEQAVLLLIKTEIAHFSGLVVHVAVQFEYSSLEHMSGSLFLVVLILSILSGSPPTFIPVKDREELVQKVDQFAIADEHNHLALKRPGVEESEQIEHPVLGRSLHEELLHLTWDALIGFLINGAFVEANRLVILHKFGPERLDLWIHRSRNKINFQFVTLERVTNK